MRNLDLENSNEEKKKVIICSSMDFTSNTAAANRITKYSKSLVCCGNEVLWVSPYNKDIKAKKEISEGIFLLGKYRKQKNKILKKILKFPNMARFIIDLNNYTKLLNSEYVFLLYPHPDNMLDQMMMLFFLLLRKKKLFCEINEVRRFGYGINNQRMINKVKFGYDEWTTRFYTGLICISTNIEEYYSIYNKNTIRIPILTDDFDGNICNRYCSQNEVFNIGFSGSIDIKKENLETFFGALQIVRQKHNIVFNLFGSISNSEMIQIKILSRKIGIQEIIKFKGVIDKKKLKNELQHQHLLVVPRRETNQNKYGFSTKLTDYISSGVPILITDVSDNLLYLEDNLNCIVAEADDIISFASKIIDLISNYNEMADTLCYNAVRVANKEFNYRNYSQELSNFLFK